MFWPGARVFDHRWPDVEGVVSLMSDHAFWVMFDNGRSGQYSHDQAPLRLGRVGHVPALQPVKHDPESQSGLEPGGEG